ncbi:MAG TPA: hypothetical protein VG407_13535 [Caulobacteraceae bacterium]|jgi:hypothetical protein|nr:hypothetical protein [Caulobacteraceae bacterium]
MHHLQKALLALAVAGASGAAGAAQAASPPPPPPPPPAHHHHHERRRPEDFKLNVEAQAQAGAVAGAGAGSWSVEEGSPSLIGALNVDTGEQVEKRRVAYEAKRKITERVVIEAVCIDDRTVPHPASQVHAERDVDDAYEGELYRCIAGTHMQATVAKYTGEVRFDRGQIIDCNKNQALYKSAHGEVTCREQIAQRDCNERSLLRRYGAGIKILTMIREETYTAYREETVTTREKSQSSALVLDGGVGGVVR